MASLSLSKTLKVFTKFWYRLRCFHYLTLNRMSILGMDEGEYIGVRCKVRDRRRWILAKIDALLSCCC